MSSVPVEGDVDALSGDVLHAAAAQGTHHARGILRERERRREGSVGGDHFTASRSRGWWWAPRSGTRRPGSTGDAPASRAWCIYDWFGVRGRTFSSIPYTRRARNRAARILVGRRRGSVRQSGASRRQQRKREGRWCRALGRRGGRSAGREGAHPESRSFRRARGSPSNVAGPISRPRASCGVRPGATPASSSSLALRRGRLPNFCCSGKTLSPSRRPSAMILLHAAASGEGRQGRGPGEGRRCGEQPLALGRALRHVPGVGR